MIITAVLLCRRHGGDAIKNGAGDLVYRQGVTGAEKQGEGGYQAYDEIIFLQVDPAYINEGYSPPPVFKEGDLHAKTQLSVSYFFSIWPKP